MYDAIVIGAGLSGCLSAIHLAEAGHKVLLLERGHFPAHKICGEFLSCDTAPILGRLGVLPEVLRAGAVPIDNVVITAEAGTTWRGKFPDRAFGLSRFELDRILFNRAIESGAECRTGTTVQSVTGDLLNDFIVHTTAGKFEGRVVIGAFGKRSGLSRNAVTKRQNSADGFVAFKEHYRGDGPAGTVEVHISDRGYCGINTIEGGFTNVCWLASRSVLKEHGGRREAVLDSMKRRNIHLASSLSKLTPVHGTLCAIGAVSLDARGQFVDDICRVGDSAQMIAPFCGDGMGMALRAGEIAAPLCSKFLKAEISRNTLIQKYTQRWKTEFSRRLALGKIIQSVVLSRVGAPAALVALNLVPAAGDWLVNQTRGSVRPSYGPSDQLRVEMRRRVSG